MTALYAFLTLIAAYVVYAIHDAREANVNNQIDAFYQVEQKKSFLDRNEAVTMGWH